MGGGWVRWGELDSGATTIAFTPRKQHETDDLTGKVQEMGHHRNPVELCFDYPDVDAAYRVCYVLPSAFIILGFFFID